MRVRIIDPSSPFDARTEEWDGTVQDGMYARLATGHLVPLMYVWPEGAEADAAKLELGRIANERFEVTRALDKRVYVLLNKRAVMLAEAREVEAAK